MDASASRPEAAPARTPVDRIVRRSDFLAANRGTRIVMPSFILLVRPHGLGGCGPRLGLTVSRKVGGAVVRNRWRRRLREAVETRAATRGLMLDAHDHVLIARPGAVEPGFDALAGELATALARAGRRLAGARP